MQITKHEYNLFLSEVRQSKFYKRLTKRTFRRHHNYPDYKYIAAHLASHLMTADVGLSVQRQNDTTYNNNLAAAWLAYDNPIFPVFAVEKDLCEALLKTDLPTHICSLQQAFKTALFLFPSNLFKNPDRQTADWFFVTHLFPGDEDRDNRTRYLEFLNSIDPRIRVHVTDVSTVGKNDPNLAWTTTLPDFSIYTSGVALPENGLKPLRGEVHFAVPVNADAETNFVESITELILKLLLYMQIQRDRTPANKQVQGVRRLHSAGFSNNAPQDFIWLGSDYEHARAKKLHQGGTHRSPETHWRRGHIRYLNMKDSDQRKPVWVRPTIVNG